jgi:hypothetical protein
MIQGSMKTLKAAGLGIRGEFFNIIYNSGIDQDSFQLIICLGA